jgi:hypothetical protein
MYMEMFRFIVPDDSLIDIDTKQLTVLALFAQDCGIVRKELDMIIPIVRNEIKY